MNIDNSPTSPPKYIAIPVQRNRPRGSFLDASIGSFRGVNSLGRFASSYQRAQSFRSIEPHIRAQRSYFVDDEELFDPQTLAPSHLGRKLSTVFNSVGGPGTSIGHAIPSGSTFDEAAVDETASFMDQSFSAYSRANSIQSYGATNYIGGNSLTQVVSNSNDLLGDNDSLSPLVLKRIENADGKLVTVIAGQSTAPQTVFNSVNVLIGVGLLALPTGMNFGGFYLGLGFLIVGAFSTYWTANLLSECLDTDPTLMTYADLGYAAFGHRARLFISLLFSADLLGVGVSLIILFGDSLNALFPQLSINQWKFVAWCVLTPLSFLPLRVLSGVSLLGILSTCSLVLLVAIIGFMKADSPGSLISPMPLKYYPDSISDVFIALGILMGPFGGHAIFPNLKVDMRHPQKFKGTLKITYIITLLADSGMAMLGFLMFGLSVMNEVTKSVLTTKGYSQFVYIAVSIMVSVIPIAKTPLNAGPIIKIIEFMTGIADLEREHGDKHEKSFWFQASKVFIKLFVNGMFVVVSILYPEFDKIIGLSGASLCSIICIILPCAFYLKLCKPQGFAKRFRLYFAIVVASVLGAISTFAAIYY